ncbi:MAG: hypothetical protein RI973_2248 [Bacteroidota bacterium]|jgi:capsular exopolysaccharide synthesis family protein
MSAKYDPVSSNLVNKLLGYWYWYVLCLLFAIVGAWYKIVSTPPEWSISGTIIVEEDKSNSGSLPEEAIIQGLPFRNRGSMDRQIQVLKSRSLMEKVVDSLDLHVIYLANERFMNRELYDKSPVKLAQVSPAESAVYVGVTIKQLSEEKFAVMDGDVETDVYNFGVPFPYNGFTFILERNAVNPKLDVPIVIFLADKVGIAANYSGKLSFQKQAQSNVLSVALKDNVPQKAKDVVYKLVEVYNVIAQEEKNLIAQRSLQFIDERLSYLSSELFQVESSQASIKTSTEVPTDVGTSAERYLDKLSTTEESVAEIKSVRTTLTNLQAFLSDAQNRYQYVPSFGDLGGISLTSFIADYNKIISERENLLRTATPEHPGAKQIEVKLNNLRNTILQGTNLAMTDMDKKEADLRAQAAPIQQKVSRLPFVDQQLTDIKRKIGVKDELVLYMLQKREETAIGLATTVESTRILDAPVSFGPIAPVKTQILIVAIFLGLALPSGVIFLMDKLNNKVNTRNDVKSLISLPYLGEVALAKNERSKMVTANSRSTVAEMFRQIRTSLDFLTAEKQEKVILVTSQMSGDGKTFVSANLGAVLALTNKKTVLIELDLRKPKLAQYILGSDPSAGVTNFLVGEKKLEEILLPVEKYSNLFLLSAGPTPPNPAELLMGHRMRELLEMLKKQFDYIVIDTPPIGLVADAYLLKSHTSVSIFVVRAGKTKKEDLQEMKNSGFEEKLTSPAIVLNGVKMPKKYGYYE